MRRAENWGTSSSLRSFLEHGELQLALEELESLGEINPCPREFWESLKEAADNLDLARHSLYCKGKLAYG